MFLSNERPAIQHAKLFTVVRFSLARSQAIVAEGVRAGKRRRHRLHTTAQTASPQSRGEVIGQLRRSPVDSSLDPAKYYNARQLRHLNKRNVIWCGYSGYTEVAMTM
ncbi:hypothetical protein MTO96_050585 [Rhipicephalus appendiculatus]